MTAKRQIAEEVAMLAFDIREASDTDRKWLADRLRALADKLENV